MTRPFVLAAGVGALLWAATSLLTGRREAWDAAQYWSYAYPAGIAAAAGIAYTNPVPRAWRIGLTLMVAQAVTLAVMARSFTLLPLGLIVFAVLAIPPALAANMASRWGMRRP